MRKLLLVGAASALGATACEPELGSDLPADVVVAQFDPTGVPAVVPSPNDLAIDQTTGRVAAPIDPNSSPAMQEFTRDYLNTLNGFPTTAWATTRIADLDPATAVLGKGVLFIDMYAGTPIATAPVEPEVLYNEETDTLTVKPKAPMAGWPKGGRYAVVLVGGENGLKGTNGRPVVGSTTWAFARSAKPLVTCEDLTASDCMTATELIPSSKTDPAERLKDQTASALRLEQLRRAYKPLLDALEKQGVKRDDVALLWTFTIVNQPEVTFDLTRSIIPFPNDLLRVRGEDGKYRLNLPTDGLTGETLALYQGLNTLDGWSTTAPIVSENSNEFGVLESGARLDANTLATGTMFLKLSNLDQGTQPNVKACLDCVSSPREDGSAPANPQQLQFVPMAPLDEQTQYAALLTTDLKDERGRRVMPSGMFAMVRLANPLVDGNGKSTVPTLLADAQAAQLEAVRRGFKPLFDGLEQAGIPRAKIALGWPFTTQSTTSVLRALNTLPAQYGQAGLPDAPLYIRDVTADYAALNLSGVKIFEGSAFFPLALTGTSGTLNPTAPVFQRAPFLLATPANEDGLSSGNLPVTIFSHGLTGNRTNAVGIISSMALAGQATIAIDTVLHGERSSCVQPTGDDSACADPATQMCDANPASATFGRCIARDDASRLACSPASYEAGDGACAAAGQGQCLPANATATEWKCQGGDFRRAANGQPEVSGNILNLNNLFATRDNFRHHVIDTAQLIRVLSSAATDAQLTQANGGTELTLDETKVNFVGQSLGGILGGLTVPVTPEIRRAVLNVPSADLVGVLLTSEDANFVQYRNGFLTKLAGMGMAQGTPAFDNFIGIARMILDPADPQNAAYALAGSQEAAGRKVFIQYAEGDIVTTNAMTEKLLAAANRHPEHTLAATKFTFGSEQTYPPESRHGFLLGTTGQSVAQVAQSQIINFFATGAVPSETTAF